MSAGRPSCHIKCRRVIVPTPSDIDELFSSPRYADASLDTYIRNLRRDTIINILLTFLPGRFSATSQRPQRIIFSPEQRALLIAAIEEKYYPTDDTIQQLANDLQISCHQIRIWFCNWRQHIRRNKIRAKFKQLKSPEHSALSLPPENPSRRLHRSYPTVEKPTFIPSPEHLHQKLAQPNPNLQRHQPDDPPDAVTLPSISSIFPDIIQKNNITTPTFISSSVHLSTYRRKEIQYSLPPITSLLQSIPLTPPTENYDHSFPLPQ
ncbi:hypothetical protein F5877DRAFT_84107 [Lentinula edodes]|nr:hypothetical protein F5877DRAFT_84107 [Lentinula edodes]